MALSNIEWIAKYKDDSEKSKSVYKFKFYYKIFLKT